MKNESTSPIASAADGDRRAVIPLYKPHIPPGAGAALEAVLESGQIAGDGRLQEFEEGLRRFVGAPHLVATAEFSRSIEMALRMAGVGPGDGVLISPLACLASTMPILQTGARPVWCDIDPQTGCLDPEEIRRKYARGVKAVLFYHWVGVPGDIEGVLRVAGELNLKVIEDAGEALGAEYGGKPVGAHGFDYSVFSLSPVRQITTGEGAAIALRDEGQARLARIWRRYGIPESGFRDGEGEICHECDIAVPGMHNYMNRLAGALGCLQLPFLPQITAKNRANGAFFDAKLAHTAGIRLLSRKDRRVPSHWVYCFLCERRDDLRRRLRETGIYASTVHIRNDGYSCFGAGPADLPELAAFERDELCVPCGWWVSEEQREHIADTIRRGW
jgi:dTDP-4-amino-4,6-dideoxygalactose transaminase